MKRALAVLGAASLLVLTAPAALAQPLVPLKNSKLPFQVSLPQGWLGADFGDGTLGVSVVSAKSPPATLLRLLYLPKEGAAVDLNQEFKNFEKGVQSSGGTLKQLSRKDARYGGVGGQEREYAMTFPQQQLRMRVWYGNGAKNAYLFQLTDTPARYAVSSGIFSKVLASLRFQ